MKMIKQPTIPPMPKRPTFDARDTQYNLPIGTDCISRRQAIDALDKCHCGGKDENGRPWIYKENAVEAIEMVEPSPQIQPEIIRCKDCKYAEYIDDVQTLWCTECGQGRTVAPDDFCSYAGRREVTT